MKTTAGGLRSSREDRPDHDGVGAGCERLCHVATDPHAAVGDHLHPPPGFLQVGLAGRGNVAGGGDLGDADAKHAAGGAGGARTDPDEDARNPCLHQLQGRLVFDAVTGQHRNRQARAQLFEGELLVGARDVAGGEHGALDDQAVGARLLHHRGTAAGMGRHAGHGDRHSGTLDGGDPLSDQVFPDGRAIDLL